MNTVWAEAIAAFFLVWLSAWGLGRLSLGNPSSLGKRFAVGYFTLPPLLSGLGISGMPVSVASRLVLVLAILGLGVGLSGARKPTLRIIRDTLFHPAFVLPFLYGVFYVGIFRRLYVPGSWDEFSHWALMPKQILLWDRLSTPEFLYRRFLDYTPGWPAILSYPQAVLGHRPQTGSYLFLTFLAGVGAFAATYDFFRKIKPDSPLFAWIMTLLLARSMCWIALFPANALVEGPLESALTLTSVLALECFLFPDPKESPPVCALGLSLASGYLIKKNFAAFFPIVLLAWPALRKDPKQIAALALPPAVTLVAWKLISAHYPHLFIFDPIRSGKPFLGAALDADARAIGRGMIHQLFPILRDQWPITALILASAALLSRTSQGRQILFPIFLSTLLYAGGLFFLYRFSFPGHEGLDLASYDRYILTLLRWDAVTLFAGAIALESRRTTAPIFAWWGPKLAPIFCGILALAVLEQTHLRLRQHRKYNGSTPELEQGPALARVLVNQFPGRSTRVLLLHQGNNEYTHFQAHYAALVDRTSPAFEIIGYPGLDVDPPSGTHLEDGHHPIRFADFQALARSADIIWPAEIDLNTESALRRALELKPSCAGKLQGTFLVKDGGEAYGCLPL